MAALYLHFAASLDISKTYDKVAFMVLHKDSRHNIVTGQPNLFQNTGILSIVLVVQINNMVAHFTILLVLIVFAKFVQAPQVLCE